jgi:hypothetical protein
MKTLANLLALILILVIIAAVWVMAVGPIFAYLMWGWKSAIGALCLSFAIACTFQLVASFLPKKK